MVNRFPDVTPYHYTHNNPINRIDPTGMADGNSQEEDEEKMKQEQQAANVINNIINSVAESVESLPSFTADQAAKTAKGGAELAKGAAKKGVKMTAIVADGVSDASTVVAAGGVVLAPFTGGSSLSITATALSVGTGADVTSTIAKTTDAVFFDGSSDAALGQAKSTAVNVISGGLLNSLAARAVTRTAFSSGPIFRSAQSGQYVSNFQGFTTTAVKDATRIAIGFGH